MPYQLNLKACLRTLRLLFVYFSCCCAGLVNADPTENYAVMLTVSVQESPATITLHWVQDADQYANPVYTVYRKGANDVTWGSGTTLGNVLTYVDSNVSAGSAYEYQVVKTTTLGYSGYGYIYAGIRAETVPHSRGKIILVVDNTFTSSLAPELARLEQDLAGDGWAVIRHDVVRDDETITGVDLEYVGFGSAANDVNAAVVRNMIISDYTADPGNVKAVLLFGRIPIFRAGNLDIDGHLARPVPADGFYGDMDGAWTRASSFLPSDVELQVGRVDLSRMTGKAVWNGPNTFPSELELLRQYLNKDHNFRHGAIDVQRQGIVGEGFGSLGGYAFGASGWRNFSTFFGSDNITRATINTTPGSWQELVCDTARAGTTYLWAEGDGAGAPAGMGALGTHGQYNQVWTRDIVGIAENGRKTPDIKAVFTHFFGSWFGEWDRTDDLLRGVLASRTMGLTASWSGVPHHYYHHMGLGENIGYSMRLSQNNDNTLYKNEIQELPRGVHIALMGDPTLRMHPVRPVTNLTLSGNTLNWTASADTALQGYHVYRSENASGPFTKLTAQPVTATTYEDVTPPVGNLTYMVRTVKLESTPGGSYLNMSQGVFVTQGGGGTAPVVSAGPDKSVSLNGSVALSGTASDDDPHTATWSKLSGPGNVYFSDITSPVTQAAFQSTGTYVLRLTANDGALFTTDETTVTVDPPTPNEPPLVYAGADQEITMPATALVSGTATDDDLLTSIWSKVNGPGAVTFGDPQAPSTTAAFSASGVYTLRLTADDGDATNFDELIVTVHSPPPAPPGTGTEFTPDAGTVALYHFNGDFNDASGNGYHLTPAGSTLLSNINLGWMLIPAGEAAGFSNLGDRLSVAIPDSAILPGAAANISIEARLYIYNYKTDFTVPNAEILTLYQDYDAGITIRDSRYHNPPGPSVFGANQIEAATSADWDSKIVTNTWYNLLMTYEAGGTLSCYVNGTLTGTSVSAPANTGRVANWTLALGDFDGLIDELRISNVIRQPVLPPLPPDSFYNWQALIFTPAEQLDPQISGHDADPDNDQISNLLEFALALDPKKVSDSGILLSKEFVAGKPYLHLQYTRRTNTTDLTFVPEVSTDLGAWNGEDIVEVGTVTNPDQTETVTVRDAISTEDAPRRFIQLEVHWGDLD